MERLSKAEKKSEALKKINEADLLTVDDFGLGFLTAQEQSLVYEIIKSGRYLVYYHSQRRPCSNGSVENTSLKESSTELLTNII